MHSRLSRYPLENASTYHDIEILLRKVTLQHRLEMLTPAAVQNLLKITNLTKILDFLTLFPEPDRLVVLEAVLGQIPEDRNVIISTEFIGQLKGLLSQNSHLRLLTLLFSYPQLMEEKVLQPSHITDFVKELLIHGHIVQPFKIINRYCHEELKDKIITGIYATLSANELYSVMKLLGNDYRVIYPNVDENKFLEHIQNLDSAKRVKLFKGLGTNLANIFLDPWNLLAHCWHDADANMKQVLVKRLFAVDGFVKRAVALIECIFKKLAKNSSIASIMEKGLVPLTFHNLLKNFDDKNAAKLFFVKLKHCQTRDAIDELIKNSNLTPDKLLVKIIWRMQFIYNNKFLHIFHAGRDLTIIDQRRLLAKHFEKLATQKFGDGISVSRMYRNTNQNQSFVFLDQRVKNIPKHLDDGNLISPHRSFK